MLLARDSIVGIFIPSSISLPASLFTRSIIHHLVNNSLVVCLQAYDVYYRVGLEIPLDAEHPTIIPMYTMNTPQAPSSHMLRPRAYAIGPKVNSLLSESSLSACKTWMLLQAQTLCILRYTR